MSIVYFQNRFPEPTQTFVYNEAAELARRGFDVLIVSSRRSLHDPPSGVQIVVLEDLPPAAAILDHFRYAIADFPSYMKTWGRVFQAGKSALPWSFLFPTLVLLTKSRNAVHLHTHFATRAARLARIISESTATPRSVTVHAADIYGGNANFAAQVTGARIATVTRFNQQHLAREGYSQVQLIRCGVPESTLASRTQRRQHQGLIISVGRLNKKKGHDHLIRAVHVLRKRNIDARLRIIGDGPERAHLSALIDELRLQNCVELLGALPHAEVVEEIASGSVFALFCVVAEDGDVDGLPVAILEAAALEVPVVAGAVTGVGEFVDASTGWLVDPTDSETAASALETALFDQRGSVARTSQAKHRVLDEFTLGAQVDAIEELFELRHD